MRLLLTTLLLASVTAYALQQAKPDHTGNTSRHNQQPSLPATQITSNNFPAPENEREAKKTISNAPQESRALLTRGETVNALLTIGLTIFSGLAWLSIKRQAKIMERSLRLQESALRQWLTTDEWNVEMGVGNDVTVLFTILNETPLPLWLETADIKVPQFEQIAAIGTWLIPKGKYPIKAQVKISDERMAGFEKGRLILPVELSLIFRDTLRNRWEQKSEITLDKYLGGINVTESRQILFNSPPDNKKQAKRESQTDH